MQVQPLEARQKKHPATVRIAAWSARNRWLVFGLWFACTIGLFVAGQVMGTKFSDATGSTASGLSKIESFKASDVFNAGGGVAASDTFVVVVSHPTLKVSDPDYKAAVTKVAQSLRTITYNDNGKAQPVFSQVVDTYSIPIPNSQLVSQDNTTTRVVATVTGESDVRKKKLEPTKALLQTLKDQNPGFQIYPYNGTLLNQEINSFVSHELDGSLKITLPLTFIILLIAFGAIAAAVVPLILAVTSLAAAFGFLAIYSNTISEVDSNSTQVIVLIGLAVGIDYSLFMITRYRAERRRGRDKQAAIEVASSTAGRAVFFSGVTVMISLAGLYMVGDEIFSSMATGTIGVVLVAVIGSLTFLPATMAILGNGINWGRIPYFGRDREEGSGFWARLVGMVMRHPVVSGAVVVILLVSLASPLLHLKLGTNGLDGLPESLDGVKALKLMNDKWQQGTVLKMNVVITGYDRADTKAAIEQFKTAALQVPGLSGPVETTPSRNGNVVSVAFYMGGSRNSDLNHQIVDKTRQELIPTYFGKLNGVEAYVGGQAASTIDLVKYYLDAMPAVFGFVLGLSFLLLLVAFHSLVIPVKAIILNLLSTGAAYGAMVLVFQDGYLSDQIGFKPTGVIENFAPLFMFTIMFGLSMDYHLFILTRIKETKDKGATSNEAVAKGISVTSGTITSAAAIMVVVFSVFVTLQMIIIRQLGFGLAVAVLVDATLIRCVLLPATMRLLNDWNWWIPKFLDWIPQITIEGASEEAHEEVPNEDRQEEDESELVKV